MPAAKAPTDTAAHEIAGLTAKAVQAPGLEAEATTLLSDVLADLPREIRDKWCANEAATFQSVATMKNLRPLHLIVFG